MTDSPLSRRQLLGTAALAGAAALLPRDLAAHDHGGVRPRQGRSNGTGQSEAHRLEVAWAQQTARLHHPRIAPRQRLMQARIRRVNDVFPVDGLQCVEQRPHWRAAALGEQRLVLDWPGRLCSKARLPSGQLRIRPVCVTERCLRCQSVQHIFDAGVQRQRRRIVGPQHGGAAIDAHQSFRGQPQTPTRAAVVSELAAEHQHEIGLRHERRQGLAESEREVAHQRERIGIGQHATPAAGEEHRRTPASGQLANRLRGPLRALPREDQRASSSGQAGMQRSDIRSRRNAGRPSLWRASVLQQQRRRDLDQYRAGLAVERLVPGRV